MLIPTVTRGEMTSVLNPELILTMELKTFQLMGFNKTPFTVKVSPQLETKFV